MHCPANLVIPSSGGRALGIRWVWIQGQLCTSGYLVSSSVNPFLTSRVSLLKVSGSLLPRLRAQINQAGAESCCWSPARPSLTASHGDQASSCLVYTHGHLPRTLITVVYSPESSPPPVSYHMLLRQEDQELADSRVGFGSQNLLAGSEMSVYPFPEDLIPSSGFSRHCM